MKSAHVPIGVLGIDVLVLGFRQFCDGSESSPDIQTLLETKLSSLMVRPQVWVR
jgi:hypothetical protein